MFYFIQQMVYAWNIFQNHRLLILQQPKMFQLVLHMSYNTQTHKHNHFTALLDFVQETWMSWHEKGKTNLDLLEQEVVSGSGISWAISKSAPWPTHNLASITLLSFLQARGPSCRPTNSIKALKVLQYMKPIIFYFPDEVVEVVKWIFFDDLLSP